MPKRPYDFRLGSYAEEPTGGTPRVYEDLPVRSLVADDGAEFEVVWYPHRDAASLMGDVDSRPLHEADARGAVSPVEHNNQDRACVLKRGAVRYRKSWLI